ncbi:MAG: GntR family transcriptional regulator [Atopostipes suicloacalis]|nr:GntR family transcriptional regulator [Atopostipes suicloacalis]
MKRNILTNHYRAGKLLPTQEELANKYDVSRATINKALKLLENERLIYSVQGSGTFVRQRMQENSSELLPFDYPVGVTYSHRDQEIESKILLFDISFPSQEIKEKLALKDDEPVYEFKRLRYLNGKIHSLEHTFMPISIVTLNEEILKGSVYDYLGSEAKLKLTDARRIVYSSESDKEISQAFHIKEGSPVLVIEQLAFDQTGDIFEYSSSYFPNEKTKFVLDIHLN